MRTIIWFIYFWIYLLFLYPQMRKAEKLFEAGNKEDALKITLPAVRKWARSLLKLAGVKVNISGLENVPKEPVLFIGNHQGNFDIPLMLGYLPEPCAVLAKIELANLPFIKNWMHLLGCVFVDRANPRQSITAINEAAQIVKGGRSMLIFPEGTRSRCDEVGEFKSGAFKLASKTGAPIVPVCIDGSYKIMEQHGFWIHAGTVNIKILEPIETKNLEKPEFAELENRVRDLIIENK